MLATRLKSKVHQRELTLGILLTFDHWAGYLEIFKSEGLDFAVLDMEHSSADLHTAEELCRTARLLDFPLLIRPEAALYHLIRKYMDMGAAGLMIPWTENQDQIRAIREAAFIPPKGRRGPGGPSIFANRGLDRQGWDEVESSLFITTQFESPAGIEDMASLIPHDWIDAAMLGPYDLSLNMGRWSHMDHPEVVAAIERVWRQARDMGKNCGMVVGTLEQAGFWIDRGFSFLICSEISGMVRHRARELVGRIREVHAEARARKT
ncbi:MAG: aldolase/citrate lyase family protein [Acidobacteriota bacterium]|nr:aldolase/citrate lyase family protein [Acidobacteriota bacterium]